MKKAAFHSSGRLDIEMYLNRFRVQRFVFTAGGTSFDITGFTWNLVIKENVGSLVNLLSYTLGNGLAFSPYEENILEARFAAADVTKTLMNGEGRKYWELVRTDTNEIWLSGEAYFKYGLFDSGGHDQDVTVNLSEETISVELQGIVFVSTSGGGGGGGTFQIVDYTGIATNGLPTGVSEGYIARVILASPFTPVMIGGVPYEHNAIIYKNAAGDWISWSANYGTQT